MVETTTLTLGGKEMTNDQLEVAEKKIKELRKFARDNDTILNFIERLMGSQYLTLGTAHQYHFDIRAEQLYELIGPELVELLKVKLSEREEYLKSMDALDLVKEEKK